MGYPMTYARVVIRNGLAGNYRRYLNAGNLAGDLRRLEHDQVDEMHLGLYARHAGVTVAQAKIILDRFFAGDIYEATAREHGDVDKTFPLK